MKWFLRKKCCCESIAFYCNNTIVLKCIRSFSLHDFSFSLAYEAMPYIQSTSSIILDSSTSAVVPKQTLISDGKSLYFGALFDEQIRTIYSPLLGTRTSAIQQISEILKKTEEDRCVQYESVAILISPLGIPGKKFQFNFTTKCCSIFRFFCGLLRHFYLMRVSIGLSSSDKKRERSDAQ